MRDPRIDRLTREILGLQRQINGLSTSSRLVNASIEDGTVHEFDRDGNLVGAIGKQHDGTHGAVTLDGPIPPRPSTPTVSGGPLALTVAWDGRYASEDDRTLLDFHLVEVYAAAEPFDDRADATLLGVFPNEAGGQLTIARPKGLWHVALVVKSTPGRRSELSDLAVAEVESVVDPEEVAEQLERAARDLTSARDLIEALRDQSGRKVWSGGQVFTAPNFRVEAIGAGRLRLEALAASGVAFTWTLTGPGGRTQSFTGKSAIASVDVPGAWVVELDTDTGPGGHVAYNLPVAIAAEMMGEDYGWSDLTLPLDQLTAPGGPLDPAVLAEGWVPVISGAFAVLTEAIIAPRAIINGAVESRHLNVVHELENGARLTVQPDGIRMWLPGPSRATPNAMWTVNDGLRFYDNDGAILGYLDQVEGLVLSTPGGGGAQVTGRGVRVFGPEDTLAIQLGAFDENALTFYTGAEPTTSINALGVTAPEGSFDRLIIGGVDFDETRNEGPRGVIYDRNFPISRRITTLGGHSYIVFDVEQGRRYEVTCRVTARNLDSKGVQLSFYHTSANLGQPLPGAPSVAGGNSSTQTAEGRKWVIPSTGVSPHYASLDVSFTYTSPGTVDKTVALLLGAEPFEVIGAGQLEVANAWWTVKDIGTSGKGSAGSYSDSGGGSSGGGSSPTPEQPKRRYTRTFTSTSWRAFQNVTGDGAGSRTTAVSNPIQGFTPFYPSAGRYGSHYYFDTAAIQAFCGGGTVLSARVRFRLVNSHANSGGTARIHLHGHSPRDDWGTPVQYLGDKHFTKGQRHWIGARHQGWATGGVRGIGLWSRSSSSTEFYTQYSAQAEVEIVVER